MVELLRHRQTKEAATDMFYLQPPRHISTLPFATGSISASADRCLLLVRQRPKGGHSECHSGGYTLCGVRCLSAERPVNKVHGFSTSPGVVFTLRSVMSCRAGRCGGRKNASKSGFLMVGAIGIEPMTSPV